MGAILLLEDNPDMLEMIKETLEMLGEHQVIGCANGRAGIVYLNETESFPSLILTDLMMPVVDGIEFLKYLRSRPDLENIPCVVISGDRKDRETAIENGADDFLVKPFRAHELQEMLDRFLG